MKRFTPTCALLAALAAGPLFAQEGLPAPDAKPDAKPKPAAPQNPAAKASNEFAYSLFRQVEGDHENLLFSPYSISVAMGMTYAGTDGNTREEIRRAMRFGKDDAALHKGFGKLASAMQTAPRSAPQATQSTDGISGELQGGAKPGSGALPASSPAEEDDATMRVANRLFPQVGFALKPDYTKLIETAYRAPLQPLDFRADPSGSKDTINAWVADQTANKIPELLSGLTQDTKLVLVNAIYFKNSWEFEFDPDATRDMPFTLDDGSSVMTPMMLCENAKTKQGFDPESQTRLVEIPFKGGSQSLVVLLPGWDKTLADVEAKLSPEFVDGMLANARERKEDLYFPKFEVESEFQLADALQALGIEDAFSQGTADFTRLSDEPGLFISKVVHKAVAGFDEKGAEAAAATAVVVVTESMPMATRIDRPFIYQIRDNATGTILFMGRMRNPTK